MSSPGNPMTLDQTLGQILRRHRKARRLTQTDIANALSLSYQQVQKYESGANQLSVSRLVQIADVLGVPLASLLPLKLLDTDTSHDPVPGLLSLRAELAPALVALSRIAPRDAKFITRLIDVVADREAL